FVLTDRAARRWRVGRGELDAARAAHEGWHLISGALAGSWKTSGIGLGILAPAVGLAHLVARDQSTAAAAAAQAAAIVAHAARQGRSYDPPVLKNAGHRATPQTVQLEAHRGAAPGATRLGREGTHAGPAYRSLGAAPGGPSTGPRGWWAEATQVLPRPGA